MQDFEKLGVFYLGREHDIQTGHTGENLLLYDSKDLVTHAVCVGMTGSGKTGLCVGLLEEAAIDGIPSIIIDPKGDLSNLMLTFDTLDAASFRPWINEEDAARKEISPDEYAQKQADLWRKGIGEWGQDASRIRRLKDSADFAIYTPGSSAGIPVSILQSFAAPAPVVCEDSDLLREQINATVTSLLNLLDIDADPVQSREHILLSTILDRAWRGGEDLNLAGLIAAIQKPPVSRIGVFDLDSFFPEKDRFALAMTINNLVAAPGFGSWLEGQPLDINDILYTPEGKPRVAIFSIAHLSETERMFFVSLMLTRMVSWMRTQSGTTSLRALLYMDEIFGYFPPVANPPSKQPLLTLLKQARAYGLGVVLATQNPVDLDYKGLSNIGTWFIGRLQTERDKERMLDGLAGVDSSGGGRFNRKEVENLLSNLGKRVFLMNNVHEDEPVVFQTRWVLSYLRGPLTRTQIKQLMDPRKKGQSLSTPVDQSSPGQESAGIAAKAVERPVLPGDILQLFVPIQSREPAGSELVYEPRVLGSADLYFADAKAGVSAQDRIALLGLPDDSGTGIDWNEGVVCDTSEDDLESEPDDDASFAEVPRVAANKKSYKQWQKDFKEWVYRNQRLELMKSPSLKEVSQPGESEREFRIRLQLAAHEKRDLMVEKLRKKYASKIATIEDRIARAEQKVQVEKEQAKQSKIDTAISLGTTIFSALLGRKAASRSTLGRASTTARRAGKIMRDSKDVDRASENVERLRERLSELETRLADDIAQIESALSPATEEFEAVEIKPRKKDIAVSPVVLAWVPFWRTADGNSTRA